MDGDPFYDVKRDIESSIHRAETLLDSYQRIAAATASQHGDKVEARDAREEVVAALALIQGDLADLEESVQIVEASLLTRDGSEDAQQGAAAAWTIDLKEINRRRQFIQEAKLRTNKIHQIVLAAPRPITGPRPSTSYGDLEAGDAADNDDDDEVDFARAYERQAEEDEFAHQDSLLEKIAKSVGVLRQQAGVIGAETLEQNSMLDSLGAGVDSTQDRLGRGMSKLKDFVKRNNDGPQGWCVLLLIVILTLLLLAVILI